MKREETFSCYEEWVESWGGRFLILRGFQAFLHIFEHEPAFFGLFFRYLYVCLHKLDLLLVFFVYGISLSSFTPPA